MKEIQVQSSSHLYNITIGEAIRFQLKDFIASDYSSVYIVTDESVADLYLQEILENFSETKVSHFIIPAGEKSKNINSFYKLHTHALKNGLDRNSLIIALGGGVVGDLAGFGAATYMRGIDYIQIPTTILAHDSSVGGKVAINHELGKNLIGNFYPPKAVIYDVETLQSLPKKEIRSGYAELVKESLIADKAFFNTIIQTDLQTLTNKQLQEHILVGIKIKASIVESDEKESGIRKFLNLGHTLGHALEAELGYGFLTHGEAVAIGLLFSLHVSEEIYETKMPYLPLIEWLKTNNYPTGMHQLEPDALISKMKTDKKVVNQTIQMVLLKGIGEPTMKEINDHDLKIYLNSFVQRLVGE
ncbi:3-dehydroquinate synthase [Virgibacillus profundi]|uniref:3-dehydroquinate synthase n=1 Tax=Virgibacillus profundi TaxID=2024555 RepID=A0A2A2IED2_9BACI|nr:3-dehydroquinate synthase [Virgibacillus profundi]PAV29495.1 3-dehydroquinate synthase [Virgibacillus profundi]PXY53664.1 3-dehydroquinate synthase [Virgibacillus profundi]